MDPKRRDRRRFLTKGAALAGLAHAAFTDLRPDVVEAEAVPGVGPTCLDYRGGQAG